MIEISLGAPHEALLKAEILEGNVERCAVMYASQITRADGVTRLLVREIDVPVMKDYVVQRFDQAELSPDYVARVSKRAKRERLSLIFVHTHPGQFPPRFSVADDDGERHLASFLAVRHPDNLHIALVLSKGGMRARELGRQEEVRVVILGNYRIVAFDPEWSDISPPPLFDRQIRAFGAQGQREMTRLRVAIVGLGGTGSIVAQQLTHLGISQFILIDPDLIDETNLNRVVAAVASDVGVPKIHVAARYIETFRPGAQIQGKQGDITYARVARLLTNADVIFSCTDSHGSRAVLQQVSFQYLIPCIDMGSTITTDGHSVSGIFGRVQMLTPGQGCLTCSDLLNAQEVRRDMMSDLERKLDPYIQGAHEPAPAVVSINGTVASLAVTMFVSFVTGIPSSARNLVYNAVKSTLRSVKAEPKERCYICSHEGAFGRGDSMALYARLD